MIDSRDSREPPPLVHAAEVVIVKQDGRASRTSRSPEERPRLSIAHLLLWTACCAVFLGVARGLAQRPSGALGALFLTLVAVGDGAAWTGLIVTLARSLRGARWSIEPGEWLLTLLGIVGAVGVLAEIASPRWLRDPRGIVEAAAACAFVLPLFSRGLVWRWKCLFGVVSFAHAFPLLTALLAGSMNLPNIFLCAAAETTPNWVALATALAAVALAVFDEHCKQRGWLHWIGIVTAVWLAMLAAIAPWLLAA